MKRTLFLSVLVAGVALALAAGSYSALAGTDPLTDVAGVVTGQEDPDADPDADDADDDGDDADDDGDDADDDGDDADDDGDDVDANDPNDVGVLTSHGDGPNPDRGCATGSLDHAREVLAALLVEDHPGENEGIQNALDKMCHGDAVVTTSSPEAGGGDGGGSEDHPGDGNAFGRGHGQGKPEGVPTNGGDEE